MTQVCYDKNSIPVMVGDIVHVRNCTPAPEGPFHDVMECTHDEYLPNGRHLLFFKQTESDDDAWLFFEPITDQILDRYEIVSSRTGDHTERTRKAN